MRAAFLLILAVVASGCASNDGEPEIAEVSTNESAGPLAAPTPAPSPQEPMGEEPPRANDTPAIAVATTTRHEDTVTGVYTYPTDDIVLAQGDWAPVAFEVPSGATGLFVELAWDPKENAVDLDLILTLPNSSTLEDTDGLPQDENGYANLVVLGGDVVPGAYEFLVRCFACAVHPYEVYVTTFAGAEPDPSYSAVTSG